MCKDKGSKRHFNIAARLSLNEFYVHISLEPMVGCTELSFKRTNGTQKYTEGTTVVTSFGSCSFLAILHRHSHNRWH